MNARADAAPALPRRRRPLRWIGGGTLLLALLAAAGLAWLLATAGGRDLLLARLLAALPPGTLSWEQAEGTVRGPLVLHGVRFVNGEVEVRADRLLLQAELLPVLSKRLQLVRLELDQVHVQLPPADDDIELPRWPEILPRLALPVPVDSADTVIQGLAVFEGETPLFQAHRITARGLGLQHEGFAVESLAIDSPQGRLALAGSYAPARNFRSQLSGRWTWAADAAQAPSHLQFSAQGDLEKLTLDVTGSAPEPLALQLALQGQGDAPEWSLVAASQGLQPALFGAEASEPWRFDLKANGSGGSARVQGEVAQGERQVGIEPSRLSLEDGRLRAQPLRLVLEQGTVDITGHAELEGETPRFDVVVASEQLSLLPESSEAGTAAVQARGQVHAAGRFTDWTVEGDAVLVRQGQEASVIVSGRGDDAQMQIDRLQADTPTGALDGSGTLRWSPTLALSLEARLDGFDPGYFLPDYPGAVNGQLQLLAERSEAGAWTGDARLDGLGGQLRQRALGGRAQASWDGSSGSGDAALRIGASQITASGRFGARYDLRARFAPLRLPDVMAGASGQLEGTLALRGPANALDATFDLVGQDLDWNGSVAQALQLSGSLPARGSGGRFRLQAQGVNAGGVALEAVDLRGQGSQAALDFELDANSAQAALASRGRIGRRGANWEGRIQSLELTAEPGPSLRLQDSAGFRYGPRVLQLDRSCLVAEGVDGRLCLSATGTTLQVQGEALPLALAQPWLPTDEAAPLFINGVVDLEAQLQQGRDGRWRGDGSLRSASGGLRLDPESEREVFGYRDLLLTLTLTGDAISAQLDAALPDDGRIAATLRTGLAATAPLQGTLQLDVRDLTWLELFSQDIADPSGRLQGQLSLAGIRNAPTVAGQARLVDFTAELPGLGLKLREGEFMLLGNADGSARLEGNVRSGDGLLRLDGSLNFRDSTAPLQLVLRGDNVTVASTAAFYAVASPDLTLRFVDGLMELRGSVVVPEARLDLESLDTNVEVSSDVVVLDPLDPPRERSRPLDMDFTVTLGDEVTLKGFGLDGRMTGSLALRERPGRTARASGALDVTGTYKAYGRVLTIERARLGFANSAFDDPTLDILAQRVFDDVTVGVQVRGTASRPETTVVSTPAMDTNEALSWLILGRPLASATGSEAARVDAAQMALGAGSNLIAQQLGAQLGLDVAGVGDSRNLGGATLTLGKYVSPRLFISYGVSLIGTGQVVTLKYLLRRGFDISIESGNENAASINWRTER